MNGDPPVRYCPFCGSDKLAIVKGVQRCTACRTVFWLAYRRRLKAAPKRKQ